MKTENLESRAKVAFVDIEATGLDANYGHMLCACVKEYGKKAKVIRIDDGPTWAKRPWCDKWLSKQLRDEIEKYDVIITYYGKKYDKPYINSRLMFHNLRTLEKQCHHDYWYTARFRLKLRRNTQQAVAAFLLPKGVSEKNHVDWAIWEKAMCGHKPSMDYIVRHCIYDVNDLERCHDKLKIFMPKDLKKQ